MSYRRPLSSPTKSGAQRPVSALERAQAFLRGERLPPSPRTPTKWTKNADVRSSSDDVDSDEKSENDSDHELQQFLDTLAKKKPDTPTSRISTPQPVKRPASSYLKQSRATSAPENAPSSPALSATSSRQSSASNRNRPSSALMRMQSFRKMEPAGNAKVIQSESESESDSDVGSDFEKFMKKGARSSMRESKDLEEEDEVEKMSEISPLAKQIVQDAGPSAVPTSSHKQMDSLPKTPVRSNSTTSSTSLSSTTTNSSSLPKTQGLQSNSVHPPYSKRSSENSSKGGNFESDSSSAIESDFDTFLLRKEDVRKRDAGVKGDNATPNLANTKERVSEATEENRGKMDETKVEDLEATSIHTLEDQRPSVSAPRPQAELEAQAAVENQRVAPQLPVTTTTAPPPPFQYVQSAVSGPHIPVAPPTHPYPIPPQPILPTAYPPPFPPPTAYPQPPYQPPLTVSYPPFYPYYPPPYAWTSAPQCTEQHACRCSHETRHVLADERDERDERQERRRRRRRRGKRRAQRRDGSDQEIDTPPRTERYTSSSPPVHNSDSSLAEQYPLPTHHPALQTLHALIKTHLTYIQNFVAASFDMAAAESASYRCRKYTTLEETKKFLKQRAKAPLTMDEARKLVEEEERL
ncbi:uncharacterized protein SPPG_04829 [Spizellomyces punctatus DAOM BR117]|uniref:DUF4614 domain-containing protein n=1 Tax=Spizellomyces punctatus (strain DAOM BR117) TaxID=645134 RepID=A0A0L0HI63_SPIPD|nr:uncharacterized protein SPPG_04829 [Spizellomyces punctatus DAOM BR117]KND00519.1 hypothetical protein SPPG_04829 [Spizellomyces punctatus DAOM BR117]|eukprot:XP_016608558.1 hypothetical protein SPPG_04829 [Spizellomyces punctatus DAOM BR117]